MSRDIYLNAIIRANKLGAQGVEVVGYTLPTSAIQTPIIMLATKIPDSQNASDPAWYEKASPIAIY